MMRDVIDRFRYRFQLWRRERREDYFGAPRTGPAEDRDYLATWFDPKHAILLTESTFASIGRAGVAYVGIIAVAAQICFVIGRLIPSARFLLGILFVTFVILWSLLYGVGEISLRKARKQYREQQTAKSSNQSMQLTADRRDDPVSIHEPPYSPSFPRFRQR